jgi:diguanylate cyclase (GGDEF)-like protein
MVGDFIRRLVLLCAGALVLACQPALAHSAPVQGSTCYGASNLSTDHAELAAQPSFWKCDEKDASIASPRSLIRYDISKSGVQPPEAFVTRLTRFDSMRITVLGADGTTANRVVGPDDFEFATSDWLMRIPLPRLKSPMQTVVIEVDGARHLGMLTEARLTDGPVDTRTSLGLELLIAGLCGMLVMPLIFNFAFFRVLRERFVLWHAAAVLCMLAHTFTASGVINRFFDLTMLQLSMLSVYSWAGGIVFAGLFIADLVEPETLEPVQKRLLRLLALWVPTWSTFYLFANGIFREWSGPVYFASFLPVLILYIWIMATGWKRNSRAMMFQIAAWSPLMVTGTIRIVSSLGIFGPPMEMLLEQHFSIALEIIITSLGVADRFLIIRRQRDNALAQTKALEVIAERDPLTGLYNRHGIEERFADLYETGFDTLAVIDLDHFKQVNDNHGHTVGDSVLRAAAEAMMPDEDTLVVRMGGEEFLLLLRGKDAFNRAERRRKAISTLVARDVTGMEWMVTASMRLVEQPAGSSVNPDFTALYSHCDRLLYEAKRAGRNRTMSEKIRKFGKLPGREPVAA